MSPYWSSAGSASEYRDPCCDTGPDTYLVGYTLAALGTIGAGGAIALGATLPCR
jgi:hypothetical protein